MRIFHLERTVIYFVQAEIIGRIKIGYADAENVGHRIAALQTASPLKLDVLALHPGGRDLEKSFHRRFSRDRIIGEWFLPSGDLMEGISEIRSRNRLDIRSLIRCKSEFPREVQWFQDRFQEQEIWDEGELWGWSIDEEIPFSVYATESWRFTPIKGVSEMGSKNTVSSARI